MKLQVELTWYGGIVEEGDRSPPSEALYDLYDADTGRALVDRSFDTCAELEAYIRQHFPGCSRWTPPPPPEKEAAVLARVLDLFEAPGAGDSLDIRQARSMLAGHLYQWDHPPETVARIRRLLGLPEV